MNIALCFVRKENGLLISAKEIILKFSSDVCNKFSFISRLSHSVTQHALTSLDLRDRIKGWRSKADISHCQLTLRDAEIKAPSDALKVIVKN
jgi:hypothetical protein